MVKGRMLWIDLCKAIGICLVVIGHFLPVATPLKIIIYSFHVPLFIMISGYLTKTERTWATHIRHRMNRLLLPYFGFAFVSLIYYAFDPIVWREMAIKFLYWHGETIWNDPIWYLFTMFIIEAVGYALLRCIEKANKKAFALGISIVFSVVIGYFIYQFRPDIFVLFGIDKALCLLAFYLLGHVLRVTRFFERKRFSQGVYSGAFLLMCILTLIINWNNNISVYHFDWNNYFVFLLTAAAGTVGLMGACQNAVTPKILKSLSKHTIFVMGTHYVFVKWGAKVILIDSLLLSLVVVALYIAGLSLWDKYIGKAAS